MVLMVRLILVRHASTTLSEAGRYQGLIDIPLSPRGIEEARGLGRRLNPLAIDQVWSSDLRRARQTAVIALPGRGVRVDPRLRELDFGAFDGFTYQENHRRFEQSFSGWLKNPETTDPPGGEALGELEARVASWLVEVAHDRVAPGDRFHIGVTHGGVIRVAVALTRGIGFERVRALSLPPCARVELDLTSFMAGIR
jgi:alpha-ribazole phosphatase/probable phosphoglycerate mutase